jgi:hypothetical protein
MPTLATLSISRHNLITCIANDNAHNQHVLNMIINDKDESYKICIFRHPPPTPLGFVKCETCNFEQPEHIDICQMCKMPYEKSLLGLRYNSLDIPDPASITLSRYTSSESVSLTSLETNSESVFLTSLETRSENVSNPDLLVTTESNITSESNSITESNILAEYNNTSEGGAGGLESEPLKCKLYIKNFKYDDKNNKYFIEHFNFAICRARNIAKLNNNHITGMYPLSKTSAMIVFSSEYYTTIALHLDNNVLWNGSYVRVQRPQGYKAPTNNIFTTLKLDIVQEVEGVDYYELVEKERKKKEKKEKKNNNMNTNININHIPAHSSKKKVFVAKPELTPQQKELVESLRKTLRKGPLECLEILCSHDGRETSVYYEPLAELCSILHDHKVFSCEVKAKQMLIKEFGQNMSYNIEKGRAGDHIKLHSIADVRALMRSANFPESAFS